MAKTVTAELPLNTSMDPADVREVFAKAGFPMTVDGNTGYIAKAMGLPAIDTGIAGNPDTVNDYNRGVVRFSLKLAAQ